MGKQFKEAVAAAKPVYGQIMGSIPQAQATQEPPEEKEAPRTQGRKGAKMPRINMAFSPENLEYLRIMSGISGQSITRYINAMIDRERIQNRPAFEAAQKIIRGENP